jgi:nucleotidyltransferase/DNA polymerase involved in DNA repair
MTTTTHAWPKVFCHVDADCFFASCERLRRPELKGYPICVLSSNDACVVAKTYDAKARGIKTGMPVWEARDILPQAVYLSADFAFYGTISEHMFMVFRRFSPYVEHYSIDEAFLDAGGLMTLHDSHQAFADDLRQTVQREVGVTVSVGVSMTRTLAKMASEFNKPNGTTILARDDIAAFLDRVELTDIPGIAQNRANTLQGLGITTARAFAEAPEALVRSVLGKIGVELRLELNGESVYPIETESPLPKSVVRSASLGEVTADRDIVHAHLTHHVTRLACELLAKKLVASKFAVFIRHKSFDAVGMEFRLKRPTDNFFAIMSLADQALEKLFRPGERYRGCGIVAMDIIREQEQPHDLFGEVVADRRKGSILQVMSEINRKYGNGAAVMLAALPVRRIRRELRFRYPMLYVD